MGIPPARMHLFWSKDPQQIDIQSDKAYIIHQTLSFGTLDDIAWLRTIYPIDEIRSVFISQPIKVYTPSAYVFSKRLLGVSDGDAPGYHYDKTLPRHIG